MVERVIRAGAGSRPDVCAIVVSPESAGIFDALNEASGIVAIEQSPPRGTGDAVRLALDAIPDIDRAVVLYADHPLLEPHIVSRLVEASRASGALVTILSAVVPDAAGYGRVVRNADGAVVRIAERKDDDPASRQGDTEINSGMMVLDAPWARQALRALNPSPATGEFYLTNLVGVAAAAARSSDSWPVVALAEDPDAAMGVNDRIDLARAEARAWERKRERLMRSGVTMRLPETIVIDEEVGVGPDTIILPYTELLGATVVGAGCVLGPAAVVRDSRLGDRVIVRSSTVEDSIVAEDTDIGPYAHLRAGSEIGPRVHIGNFAEIKNARLAAGVKVGHFSYLGDAGLGRDANIGAGTVTANYDGASKHRTEIGAGAFIGSDTILRAPVRIGAGARTGAGSVVTKDVPDGATVVGVPARIVRRGSVDHRSQNEEV
jgi:bifunctional UDP-N-acetylglucosamine pyrophosphorylase/glucosamine-1-phosphate N-acetyltransferase